MKEYLHPSLENIRLRSEFDFNTVAAVSRSVAKRMFELLTRWKVSQTFQLSNEGFIFS